MSEPFTSALPPLDSAVEELDTLVWRDFDGLETEYAYRQQFSGWALNVRVNSHDWYSVIRSNGKWTDENGSLWNDEDADPIDASDRRLLIAIAYWVALGVIEEMQGGELANPYMDWFVQAVKYLEGVRDLENPSGLESVDIDKLSAATGLSAISFNVNERLNRA